MYNNVYATHTRGSLSLFLVCAIKRERERIREPLARPFFRSQLSSSCPSAAHSDGTCATRLLRVASVRGCHALRAAPRKSVRLECYSIVCKYTIIQRRALFRKHRPSLARIYRGYINSTWSFFPVCLSSHPILTWPCAAPKETHCKK